MQHENIAHIYLIPQSRPNTCVCHVVFAWNVVGLLFLNDKDIWLSYEKDAFYLMIMAGFPLDIKYHGVLSMAFHVGYFWALFIVTCKDGCRFYATCSYGRCECDAWCLPEGTPVCTSDGQRFNNDCERKKNICENQRELTVVPCEPRGD